MIKKDPLAALNALCSIVELDVDRIDNILDLETALAERVTFGSTHAAMMPKVKPEDVYPLLHIMADAPEWWVRYESLEIVGRISELQLDDVLRDLSDDSHDIVRAQAERLRAGTSPDESGD